MYTTVTMQSETMPAELNLTAPPTIPQARSYISRQQSEFTEYDIYKGQRVRINLPRLQRSYLMKDSYIRFRMNVDIATVAPTYSAVPITDLTVANNATVSDYLFDKPANNAVVSGNLFWITTATNLPSNLSTGTKYYIRDVTTGGGHTSFKISNTADGLPLSGICTSFSVQSANTSPVPPTFTELKQILAFDRAGAMGLFDRIEVYDYLGGTLVEQTQNIPTLATLLHDIYDDIMDDSGKKEIQGMSGPLVITPAGGLDIETLTAVSPVTPSTSGSFLWVNDATYSSSGYFISYEFTLPVFSFLGLLSEKYVPLHNGFSVDFFLSNFQDAIVSRLDTHAAANGNINIKNAWINNFEYVCHVMELGDVAESIVLATEPLVIHSKQYRYFKDQLLGKGQQSSFRFDLNLNVVSLRNILFDMRPMDYQNNYAYPSYGHRIRNFLENWNFQYGSSYLPEIAGISTRSSNLPVSKNSYGPGRWKSSEAFKAIGASQSIEELAKVFNPNNVMNGIDVTSYCIDTYWNGTATEADYKNWNMGLFTLAPVPFAFDSPTVIGSVIGKFAAGLNTRLSNKTTVSGIDTNGLQLSINGSFDRDNISNMVDAILDVWCEHDAFIQIIPGVATTVTF